MTIPIVLNEVVTLDWRSVFLEKLNDDFAALSANPQLWQQEQQERALWEQTLSDGLSDEEKE